MATISLTQPGGGGTVSQGGVIFPATRCYPAFSSTATSYVWSLTGTPTGSATVMNSTSGAAPYFDPDVFGQYAFQLVATGGADAGTYTCTVFCQGQTKQAAAGQYMQTFENNFFGLSSSTVISANSGTSGVVSFVPFSLPAPMAVGVAEVAISQSFSTLGNSSGQQTATQSWAVYSRVGGSSGTALSQIMASSFTIGVTGNNSTYSVNQPTSTAATGFSTGATTSAGSNMSSAYTGAKLVQLPINQTLQAGQYWLGLANFNSTSSIIVGVSQSYLGANHVATLATLAPIGSYSSGFSSGTNVPIGFGGNWNLGLASFTSAGQTNLPASVAMSALTQNVSLIPYLKFIGTA